MPDKVEPRAGELTTTHYGWTKPTVGSSTDAWGGYLNADLDGIDTTVWNLSASLSGYLPLAGGTLTGALNVNVGSVVDSIVVTPTASVGANLVLNKASGQASNVWGKQASLNRWQLALGNGIAEATGNVGSDFAFTSYDNTGAALGVPLMITRSNGLVALNGNGATLYTGASPIGSATLFLNKAGSGTFSFFGGYNNGVPRWTMYMGNNTAEGGSNAGSDFQLNTYSDTAAALGTPLAINRASGLVTISGNNAGGNATLALNKTAASGSYSIIQANTSGIVRWQLILSNPTAESGTATGSDFALTNFNNSGANIATPLSINRASSVATFAVAIVNGSSDRTLKENIEPLEGALDKVNALQGVSFNMIATPDKREIGLIAQDVEPIVPEIIQDFQTHDSEGKAAEMKLALDYPKLVALLVEAVKTLTARIEVLEAGSA